MYRKIQLIGGINWQTGKWWLLLLCSCLLSAWLWPEALRDTVEFVLLGLVEVSPLVVPGILISAWVSASGAGGQIRQAFSGSPLRAVLIAAFIGALTPVCGVTVLPLMAGLLASGVPLAPVMAFWLASPVTDPAMFAVTAATLGFQFAIVKTAVAFLIGLGGGMTTALLNANSWVQFPLRSTGLAATLGAQAHCAASQIEYAFWQEIRHGGLNSCASLGRCRS